MDVMKRSYGVEIGYPNSPLMLTLLSSKARSDDYDNSNT